MSEQGNENNQVPEGQNIQQPVQTQQPAPQYAPLPNAPGAVASMVCGIIGFFVCGLIFGIIAIVLGNKAKQVIATQPGAYGGAGMAQAGVIMGIISLVIWVIIIAIQVLFLIIGAASAAGGAQ